MATVTPGKKGPNRSKAEPASKQAEGDPNGRSGSKQIHIDKRLESARHVLESQPSTMIVPISEASLAMHSTSVEIRLKRSGVSKLETNDDLFPKSIHFMPKFDAPEDLLQTNETKQDTAEFNKLIKDAMIGCKLLIIKQGNRTIGHMEEKRRILFIKNTLTLAGHYATYHRMLHIVPIDTRGLTDTYVGGASLYCYFNGIEKESILFEYLFEDKNDFMTTLKKAATKSATGAPILDDKILDEITVDLDIGDTKTSAQIDLMPLPYDHDPAPRFDYDNNSDATQGAQIMDAEQTQQEEENPFDTPGNRRLIKATAHSLRDIIIPVFYDTEHAMALVHQEKVANAKLAAAIKQSSSLAIANQVQLALAEETSVQPENMVAVVSQQATKIWKQHEKTLIKELRKNTSGGARVTATNPNVQSNGEESKKQPSKQATKAKQPSWKQPKRKYEGKPKPKGANPYPTNQRSNKSYHSQHQQGRGGRGRGRNPGRGRGRGGRGRGRGRDT
jgi:hypothetical protein